MSPILDSKTTPLKQPKKPHKDKLDGGFNDFFVFTPILPWEMVANLTFLAHIFEPKGLVGSNANEKKTHPKIPSNCPGIWDPYCLRSLPGFTSSWLNSFSVGRSVCLVRGLDTSWSVCLVCYVCVWDFMYLYIYIIYFLHILLLQLYMDLGLHIYVHVYSIDLYLLYISLCCTCLLNRHKRYCIVCVYMYF